MKKLLIDGLNTKSGGGVVLLKYLVSALEDQGLNYYVVISDSSVKIPCKSERILIRKYSLFKRDKILIDIINLFSIDTLLCFGNFPPSKKMPGIRVITFVQSMFVAKKNLKLKNYPLKFHIDYYVKTLYFNRYKKYSNQFIVQADHVKLSLSKSYDIENQKIFVLPFYYLPQNNNIVKKKTINTFIYISDGMPHKNHASLIAAWKILSNRGLHPLLTLTLADIDYKEINKSNLKNINNISSKTHDSILSELNHSQFCIYPTLLETIGLGLIESANANCKVLVSNLPFIKEIIRPSLTFDPLNPEDIANCVEKALLNDLDDALILLKNDINNFIDFIFS